MAYKYDMTSDVATKKEACNLLVRVVKLWHVAHKVKDRLQVDSQLNDILSSRDRILATMCNSLIYQFEGELKKWLVHTMTTFGTVANVGTHRTTKHPFKLNYQFTTKVKIAIQAVIPPNTFSFTPVVEVFRKDYDTEYLVDVMGMLTARGKEKEIDWNGAK
ncbi:Replication protein A 70 kDa DNA-binding subunit [Spatholobus suberectus]|nr:Replication protein A 70 kDa DNA-binding subunit [Spatholobus suberectus]